MPEAKVGTFVERDHARQTHKTANITAGHIILLDNFVFGLSIGREILGEYYCGDLTLETQQMYVLKFSNDRNYSSIQK